MSAFPHPRRRLRPDEPKTSSIYSVPASEAIDRVPDQLHRKIPGELDQTLLGARATDRKRVRPVITRKGKVLCADGVFRLPHDEDVAEEHALRSSKRLGLSVRGQAGEVVQYQRKAKPKLEESGPRATRFREEFHDESSHFQDVAAKEAIERPIAVSKSHFVPVKIKSNQPPGRRSFVRRLSDSVKDVFHCGHRQGFGKSIRPATTWKKEPKRNGNPAGDIDLTQRLINHSRAQQAKQPSPPATRRYGDLPRRSFDSRPSTRCHSPRPQKTYSPIAEPRIGKVVGDSDRATRLTDFINASRSSEMHYKYGQQTKVNKLLVDKPLPPLPLKTRDSHPQAMAGAEEVVIRTPGPRRVQPNRQMMQDVVPPPPASKRVDTSRKSWLPPEPRRRNMRRSQNNVPSLSPSRRRAVAHALEITGGFATVGELFEEIDHAKHDWEEEEEAEPSISIDTWDRGSHVSWVCTQRADPRSMHSHYRRFESGRLHGAGTR